MTELPIHRWNFDDPAGSSTAQDEFGGVAARLVNSSLMGPGYSGPRAAHIDGSNGSYISFGATVGAFGTADFTVSFWVNTSEQVRLFDLMGNRTAPSHGNFLAIRMTGRHESMPPGQVTVEVDQDGDGTNYIAVVSKATGLNDGKWHNIAVARQGARLMLYIDGALDNQAAGAGVANIQNGSDFRAGRSLDMDVPRFGADALYDDVRLYNIALVPAPGLSEADLRAAIARYAPIMKYHSEERYLPCSVEWFLQNALLCQPSGKVQATPDNLPSTLNAPDDHKYWLELKDDAAKVGNLQSAVAYVHAKPASVPGYTDITFWFCFGYNGAGTAHLFPIKDRLSLTPFGQHYGDWETVTLRIDDVSKALSRVYLSQHAGGAWVDNLADFSLQNGRIVIYSSLNGHASYKAPGSNPSERAHLPAWPFPGDLYDFSLVNLCDDGASSLDCAAHYQLVSAEYLGAKKPVEPKWLNFGYRWGPSITYPAGTLENWLNGLGAAAWLLAPLTKWIVGKLPSEAKGEDGPTGPKTKSSWSGAPDS